jgi:hypothetical protein
MATPPDIQFHPLSGQVLAVGLRDVPLAGFFANPIPSLKSVSPVRPLQILVINKGF